MSTEHRAQSRNVCLDSVRGLAIFLVVFGHCIQYGNGKDFDFFGDILFRIIYSFHMPLFALLSGYLFFVSMKNRTTLQLCIRQIASLIIPAFSWSALRNIFIACVNVYSGTFEYGGIYDLAASIYKASNFWFLWAILLCSSGVFITERFFSGRLSAYIFEAAMLLFVPGYIVSSLYIFVYPYFVAGYIWHREGLDKEYNHLPEKTKIMLGISAIIIWCIMLVFFRYGAYIYTTGTKIILYHERTILFKQLIRDIFRWLIGFAGSASVIFMIMIAKPVKILAYLGTKSMRIYIR